MKLTNMELNSINVGLSDLADEKIKGKLKFKLFKNKVAVEDKLAIVREALEGTTDEEAAEIMAEKQEVELDLLTYDELEPLALSLRQLGALQPILEGTIIEGSVVEEEIEEEQ